MRNSLKRMYVISTLAILFVILQIYLNAIWINGPLFEFVAFIALFFLILAFISQIKFLLEKGKSKISNENKSSKINNKHENTIFSIPVSTIIISFIGCILLHNELSTSGVPIDAAVFLFAIMVVSSIIFSIRGFLFLLIKSNKSGDSILSKEHTTTVVNNYHYGNTISTQITDSVVQRSNIGMNNDKCSGCGKERVQGEKFCMSCGTAVV